MMVLIMMIFTIKVIIINIVMMSIIAIKMVFRRPPFFFDGSTFDVYIFFKFQKHSANGNDNC